MVLHVIAADNEKDAAEMQLLETLVDRLKIPNSVMEKVYARYFEDKKNRQ